MSKGSRPRPFSVSQEKLGNNFESIFGKKVLKEQYVPPPLPDEVKEESKAVWENGTREHRTK